MGGFGINFIDLEQENQFIGVTPENLQLKADRTDILWDKTANGTTRYAYNSKVPVSNVVDQNMLNYAQDGNIVIGEEIVSERTGHSKKYSTDSINKYGNPVFISEFFSGGAQLYKDHQGNWQHVEYATTTEEVFLAMTKSTLKERFVGLFIAHATDTEFFSDTPDGFAGWDEASDSSWTEIRAKSGNVSNPSQEVESLGYVIARTTTDKWKRLFRTILRFNTRSIGSDEVTSSTVSVHGSGAKASNIDATLNFSTSNPISDTTIENADYDQSHWGDTKLSDAGILFSDATTSDYNNFKLNSAGNAAINTTGTTTLGLRLEEDIDNSQPTWSSGADGFLNAYMSERTGTGEDPRLVVTHSAPAVLAPKNVPILGFGFF